MTAAKIMDIISRLPRLRWDKQQMQYRLYTPSEKWKDAHKLLKIPKSECPQDILDSSTTTQMAEIMVQCGRPSCSSWAESVRSSFGRDYYGKKLFEKTFWNTVGRRFPLGNACSYTVTKGLFLSVYVDDIKIGWKETETSIRCGKYSTKKSIWEKQHLFLDHVYLGCTQRQCEISKDIVDN